MLLPSPDSDTALKSLELLHKNKRSQSLADGQAGVADLADAIGLVGQKLDDLLFAKANLTKANLHLRRCAQPFDSHSYARFHAA